MIPYWSYMPVVIATFLLGLISASEIRDHRRYNQHDNNHQHHHAAIDGGWSDWSSTSCSTTCGNGVREETRTCTNPAPMLGGNNCTGGSTRQSNCTNGPCPTTAPQTITQCTSDLNCSSFTCPGHQHPRCEPYLDWSQCGCTDCTRDEHCSCPQGMIGNCRDDIFERNCECQQLTGTFSHCTDDADCSTHKCTGNLRQSFCHKNKLHSFDLSTCDCRECSKDSHCHCQSGLIPHCESTTFGNACQCKQSNTTTTTGMQTTTTTLITKTTLGTTAQPTIIDIFTMKTTEIRTASTNAARTTTTNDLSTQTSTNGHSNQTHMSGVTCPVCDENLNCSWDKDCFPGQVCMIGLTLHPIISHCSEPQDCSYIERFLNNGEIFCCKNRQCISKILGI